MKKPYEKPFIIKQQGGIINKFGVMNKSDYEDNIDGVKVNDLVSKHGSPLFVYSEKKIKDTYQKLIDSFTLRYPRVQHAWSYKTNYLKAICKTFHNLGSWAEVVSEMEYNMALKLGVKPANIVFNGPCKSYDILKKALKDGALINVDNLDELYDVEKIAQETNSKFDIGIRVNMSLGNYMAWDRFGFNIESGLAYQAVNRAVSGGKINITGIHCHIGTFILDPTLYKMAVESIIEFYKVIKRDFGIKLKYIDMGGGFASHNKLKATYLYTSDIVPFFSKFSEAITEPLLHAFKPEEQPLLILETGRALIDEAGVLVSTVASTKRLPSGIRAIVLDAGVNNLFTSFWYDHMIVPTENKGTYLEDQVVYGPLCMQIDVIRDYVKLPYFEKGDKVIIKPVGAYNNTQWLQFINLRPNVILISEKGDVSVIREAETIDYLQEREKVPEWMAK